jgi:hypothetical protein
MKKAVCVLLFVIMLFALTSCEYIDGIIYEVNRELAASSNLELVSDNERNREPKEIEPGAGDDALVVPQTEPEQPRQERARENTPPPVLDMSSPSAFIDSVWERYGIILQDHEELLYTAEGLGYKQEIAHALWLFSPEFMRTLADTFHKEHRATYIIRLGGHNDDQYGTAEWYNNIIITIYKDNDPAFCGITAPVLAHEIGHTIHYLIEEYITEEQSERDMESFNGGFYYVGDDYDSVWRYKLHGNTFAYDYSLHCYYEDIATIFELLVEDPEDMARRLADPWNEPLLLKTQYIREMTYRYVSDECWMVFMPLYEAEEILGLRAAA